MTRNNHLASWLSELSNRISPGRKKDLTFWLNAKRRCILELIALRSLQFPGSHMGLDDLLDMPEEDLMIELLV